MRLLLGSEEHTSELQSPCNLVCVFCLDRKSTRLNSSHLVISYAVFCLKKKTNSQREVAVFALFQKDFTRSDRNGPLFSVLLKLPAPQARADREFCFFFFNKPAPAHFYLFPLHRLPRS